MPVLGDSKFVLLGLEVCGFCLKGGSAGLYEIEFGTELLLFEFDTLLQLHDACLYLQALPAPLTDPALPLSDLTLYLPEQPPLDSKQLPVPPLLLPYLPPQLLLLHQPPLLLVLYLDRLKRRPTSRL